MGKKSKRPSYSNGSVTLNGQSVATSKKNKDGTISSSYNMNSTEEALYNGIQSNLLSSVKNLFTITDADKKLWQQELDAYKKQGIDEINSIYTPMENNLKNDIAGRFGNLDNSIFLDKLSTITDNKAKAVSDLSESLAAKQDELYSNELSNRMSYITLLSGLNTNMNNQILAYMNMAKSNSDSGNNYNKQNSSGNNFLSDALNAVSNML